MVAERRFRAPAAVDTERLAQASSPGVGRVARACNHVCRRFPTLPVVHGVRRGQPAFVPVDDDRVAYRQIIDRLVDSCKRGQGQITRQRVVEGVWRRHPGQTAWSDVPEWMREVTEEFAKQSLAVDELLARLDDAERDTLARLFEQEFVSGMHETLVVLHDAGIPPFDDAYEGTPFHDFAGRLDGWTWPTD